MFEMLPEELLHQILAIHFSVYYDVFASQSPEELLARGTESIYMLLVCKRWRRVATPLVYETIIIASQLQATALASTLRRESLGSHVKKLRIEGGFGKALHTILSLVPRLVYLSLSLDITAGPKGAGLCIGLELVNPQYVVLRDTFRLGNKGVRSVVDAPIECMTTVWTNMISYDHPYDEYLSGRANRDRVQRAKDLARALVHIPGLKTVYVPRAYYTREDDVVLNALKNPSVQRIFSWIVWQEGFPMPLDRYPRLRDIVYLPLPGPWSRLTYAAIGPGHSSSVLRTTFRFSAEAGMFEELWGDQ